MRGGSWRRSIMIHEPRYILTANSPIVTSDGRRGRLRQALLSPSHRRLVALVVRYGILPPRDVVVPAEQIAAITDTRVRLRLSRAELAQLPAARSVALAQHASSGRGRALVAVQYGSGGTSQRILDVSHDLASVLGHRQSNPANEILALHAGQRVWSADRQVGTLRHLIIDQT